MKCPEHEKLAKVHEKSQECGSFLEWLLGQKGYSLAKYHEHTKGCYAADDDDQEELLCGASEEALYPENPRIEDLLAEFYGIDLKKLEAEKLWMLKVSGKAAEKNLKADKKKGARQCPRATRTR